MNNESFADYKHWETFNEMLVFCSEKEVDLMIRMINEEKTRRLQQRLNWLEYKLKEIEEVE